MNKTSDKTTVILIPAYQPQHVLVESTDRLLAAGFAVVVVDDGSEAEYVKVFDKLDKNIHFIRHPDNRGKGAALKTGFGYIQRTFEEYVVVTADADGQHATNDIEKVAREYLRHPGTLLLGSRTFEASDVPLRSKFGNVLTRKIFSLLTRQRLHDTQTGLRAFDESLTGFMTEVPGERFEYEMNVLLACSRARIEIVELPIQTIYENGNETSHFDPIKDSLAIYGQIIRFASSSLLSFGVDYSMFLLLLALTSSWGIASSVIIANIVARLISASFNFMVNKHVVFHHDGSMAKDLFSYALLAVCILTANTVLLAMLTNTLGIPAFIAKIITEIVLFIASYYVQKNIIFNRKQTEAQKV